MTEQGHAQGAAGRKPARVLYLTLEAPRVGQASHVHVSEIIAGLRRRGHEVVLFRPSYTDAKVKPGVAGRMWEYVRLQLALIATLRRGDVIYVRGHFMAVMAALWARLTGTPILHEVNGPYQDIMVTYPWLRSFAGILGVLQRSQYRWGSRLLPVTQELGDWLRQESGHDRITVIPNGANVDLFNPDAPALCEVPEGSYVIFFGGLAKWHGVGNMLAAVERPEWPQGVRLVVVGDGQERDKVAAAAQRNQAVVFMGYRPYDVLPGLVARSLSGIVAISDPDGRSRTGLFPLKLFETLAAGVPAVVTDFPGQADLIRDHACGLVIPPDDPKALAEAVAELAANPDEAKAMGRRGCHVVRTEHSWQHRANQTADLIATLTEG